MKRKKERNGKGMRKKKQSLQRRKQKKNKKIKKILSQICSEKEKTRSKEC